MARSNSPRGMLALTALFGALALGILGRVGSRSLDRDRREVAGRRRTSEAEHDQGEQSEVEAHHGRKLPGIPGRASLRDRDGIDPDR